MGRDLGCTYVKDYVLPEVVRDSLRKRIGMMTSEHDLTSRSALRGTTP